MHAALPQRQQNTAMAVEEKAEERFLTYLWDWIMRHALDASHCASNEWWTQRKTSSGQISSGLQSQNGLGNLLSKRLCRTEDSKDVLQLEICSANISGFMSVLWVLPANIYGFGCKSCFIFTEIVDIVLTLFPYFPSREMSENMSATAKKWVR